MKLAIEIKNICKEYSLGTVNHKSFQKDFQLYLNKIFQAIGLNYSNNKFQHINEKILALKNLSLNIEKGKKIGLIGKNGSGKSTLLKIISGITAPTIGEVYLTGRVSSLLEVGVGFHGELTGRENIYLSGSIMGIKKNHIDNFVTEIIEFSEIHKYIDTPVKRYSSGMIVKLGFAVSTIFESEILIVDEVLAVGDKNFRKKAMDKMLKICEKGNQTVLFVSHNMDMIKEFCEQCVVLEKGELVYFGDTNNALNVYNSL